MNLPSFTEVSDSLVALSSLGTAGESHGLLCALLSFSNKIREQAWVDSLLSSHIEPGDAEGEKAYQTLMTLFRETAKAFEAQDFELPLLLPDDEFTLEDRIDGLAEWCQGYLTGLHLMGVKLEQITEPADLKEALDDLLAISQVELTSEDENDPESEQRFVELLEHVKVAVLTVSIELKEVLSHRENATVH